MNFVLNLYERWGYKVVDSIDWIKVTVNYKIAQGNGYYLQHAFETCLIGVKGTVPISTFDIPDIIYAERRKQSQKPDQIYEYCEEMVKDGLYLEIFGRRNNLRDGWITIGNEI